MLEAPLLIFSNYCNYSKAFLESLHEHPNLFNSFNKLCIDIDKQTKQRPEIFYKIQKHLGVKITNVPTIIVENGTYVLSGEEAFKWLQWYAQQQTTPQQQQQTTEVLEAFNPNEMGSFSDTYSKIGTSTLNDATDQSFHFLNKPATQIYTPPETEDLNPDDLNRKQKEREAFTNTPSRKQAVSNTNINNWKSNNDKKRNYQDVDRKLEQLMAEREQQLN